MGYNIKNNAKKDQFLFFNKAFRARNKKEERENEIEEITDF